MAEFNEHHPEDVALKALFAEDLPPRHDADFVVAVAGKVSRRRMLSELAGLALTTAVTALILWAVGPVLAPVLKPVSEVLLWFTPVIAILAGVFVLVHPRTHPA